MRLKVEKFQTFVQQSQAELGKMQQELQTKAAVLDAKVIQEKNQEIALKKKRAERDLADKEENLRTEIQNKQMKIRDNQLSAANEVFKNAFNQL